VLEGRISIIRLSETKSELEVAVWFRPKQLSGLTTYIDRVCVCACVRLLFLSECGHFEIFALSINKHSEGPVEKHCWISYSKACSVLSSHYSECLESDSKLDAFIKRLL
jgi:hypothetical protein